MDGSCPSPFAGDRGFSCSSLLVLFITCPSLWSAVTNGVVVIDGDRLRARLAGACVFRRPQIARVESHLLAIKVESGAAGDALVSAAPVVGGGHTRHSLALPREDGVVIFGSAAAAGADASGAAPPTRA